MSDTAVPQKKGVSLVLIFSLCFNFFLAGIIVLGTLRAFHHAHQSMPARQLLMPQAVKFLLPENEQSKLDSIISAHHDALMRYRDAAVDGRAVVFKDYTAKDFSAAKLAADLEKVREADVALEQEAFKAVTETAAALPPQERQMVADHLKQELWRDHWRHGH